MKKFSLILTSYAEYKLLFLLLFFSNYWPLLSNVLKRNTYTSLDLNLVILNEIWPCHVNFWQAKTAEEEVNLVQNGVSKSARYKNKWAFGIIEQWQN